MNGTSQPPVPTAPARACAVFLLGLAIGAGPSALGAQDVYKSVDSQGRVTFSDRPPPDADKPAVPVDDAVAPPPLLHFCWTNCFTLKNKNGIYVRTDGTDENWTVERFTSRVFVLRRHDSPAAWNGYQAEVKYAGRIANEQLIDITVDGRPVSDIQMSWGGARHIRPGSNAERDRLAAQGPGPPAGEPPPSDGAPPDASAAPQVTTSEVPPPLPDEEQPACDVVGDIWIPGYWAWAATGYYWVRGAWMLPPRMGVLWTPGYWVLVGSIYVFHPGYWAPHVGYYGGINYGHGYYGSGYSGGHWVGTKFFYNAAVSRLNTQVIHDIYREETHAEFAPSRLSYHGVPESTTVIHLQKDRIESAEPAVDPQATPRAAAHRAAHGTDGSTAHRSASRRATVVSTRTPSDTQSAVVAQPKQPKPPKEPKEPKPDDVRPTSRGSTVRPTVPNLEK